MDYKAERQLKEAERLLGEESKETWTCRCGTGWLMEDEFCADCGRSRNNAKYGHLNEKDSKMMDHIMLEAYPAINAKVEETDEWNGEIECPACGKKLYYTKCKSNEHIHGNCETKGCLQWMQ